jgi:hypothetical protein
MQTNKKRQTHKQICKLITSRDEQVPLYKLIFPYPFHIFPALCGTKMFIAVIKQPTICPYPEPVESSPRPPIKLLQVLNYLTYPPTARSHKRLLSFSFPCQNISTCFSSISSVLFPPL